MPKKMCCMGARNEMYVGAHEMRPKRSGRIFIRPYETFTHAISFSQWSLTKETNSEFIWRKIKVKSDPQLTHQWDLIVNDDSLGERS